MSPQRSIPLRSTVPYQQGRQNHYHSNIPPNCRSETSNRNVNKNYQDTESRSRRSISPANKRFRRYSRSPNKQKDKEIALLTTTVQSLINEVRILKADKSTTPKDHDNNEKEVVPSGSGSGSNNGDERNTRSSTEDDINGNYDELYDDYDESQNEINNNNEEHDNFSNANDIS
ncbi:17774_t:CDS:2, partial [Racocetra persica]